MTKSRAKKAKKKHRSKKKQEFYDDENVRFNSDCKSIEAALLAVGNAKEDPYELSDQPKRSKKICVWLIILAVILAIYLLIKPFRTQDSETRTQETSLNAEPIQLVILPKEKIRPKLSRSLPKALYLNIQGAEAERLKSFIAKELLQQAFELVDTPAKAQGIVQVAIMHWGRASEDSCNAAIKAGYGEEFPLSGDAAQVLLCDLLLVEREIAKERNDRQTSLATISNRHIRGSLQERLGVVAYGQIRDRLPEEVAKVAAAEVTQIILHRWVKKSE